MTSWKRKTSCLIIPDADVIIHLHELEYWKTIVGALNVAITGTVSDEVMYYHPNGDQSNEKLPIVLREYESRKQISIIGLNASQLSVLDPVRVKHPQIALHSGEEEMLAHAMITTDDIKLCLKERAAIKLATYADLRDKIVSVEDVLRMASIKYKPLSNGLTSNRFSIVVQEALQDTL